MLKSGEISYILLQDEWLAWKLVQIRQCKEFLRHSFHKFVYSRQS